MAKSKNALRLLRFRLHNVIVSAIGYRSTVSADLRAIRTRDNDVPEKREEKRRVGKRRREKGKAKREEEMDNGEIRELVSETAYTAISRPAIVPNFRFNYRSTISQWTRYPERVTGEIMESASNSIAHYRYERIIRSL